LNEEVKEADFQYVPDTPRISPLVPGSQALAQSMLLLEESIESGAVLEQFEQLYRRNIKMVIEL
jgi:tyrosine-protein phosphatase non-receptor type 4